jgi:predicted TIM-barrel fold metal-dependent hydrolase
MKIDIHCHTTNRQLDTAASCASLEAIAQEMQRHGIKYTVLLATYFPHRGSGISNYRLHHMIATKRRFMMFGSLDFETYFYQGFNELEEMASKQMIHGIKIYTCYQDIGLKGKELSSVLSLAERHALPMMFHVGYSYSCRRVYGKDTIAALVTPAMIGELAKSSAADFIISHMGKPFFDETRAVSQLPNVYTDMSGLIDSRYDRDEIPEAVAQIRRFVEHCGAGKLLFGTDFPVQTHEDSIYFIEEGLKGFSAAERRAVYFDNAAALLFGKEWIRQPIRGFRDRNYGIKASCADDEHWVDDEWEDPFGV